jgi:hypothetical protein
LIPVTDPLNTYATPVYALRSVPSESHPTSAAVAEAKRTLEALNERMRAFSTKLGPKASALTHEELVTLGAEAIAIRVTLSKSLSIIAAGRRVASESEDLELLALIEENLALVAAMSAARLS